MATTCGSMITSLGVIAKQIKTEREKLSKSMHELSLQFNKRSIAESDEVKKLIKKLEAAIKSSESCQKDAAKSFETMKKQWHELNPGSKNFAGPMVSDECSKAATIIQVGIRTDIPELAKLVEQAKKDVKTAQQKLPR